MRRGRLRELLSGSRPTATKSLRSDTLIGREAGWSEHRRRLARVEPPAGSRDPARRAGRTALADSAGTWSTRSNPSGVADPEQSSEGLR